MNALNNLMTEMKEKFEDPSPQRMPDDIEENPIGLEQDAATAIARELDSHQCTLSVLFHQYQKLQTPLNKYRMDVELSSTTSGSTLYYDVYANLPLQPLALAFPSLAETIFRPTLKVIMKPLCFL